jgi:hypothetical protein
MIFFIKFLSSFYSLPLMLTLNYLLRAISLRDLCQLLYHEHIHILHNIKLVICSSSTFWDFCIIKLQWVTTLQTCLNSFIINIWSFLDNNRSWVCPYQKLRNHITVRINLGATGTNIVYLKISYGNIYLAAGQSHHIIGSTYDNKLVLI